MSKYLVGDAVICTGYGCEGLIAEIDDANAELGGRYLVAIAGSPVAIRSAGKNLKLIRRGSEQDIRSALSARVDPPPFAYPRP